VEKGSRLKIEDEFDGNDASSANEEWYDIIAPLCSCHRQMFFMP
jgi:hypothetical protein